MITYKRPKIRKAQEGIILTEDDFGHLSMSDLERMREGVSSGISTYGSDTEVPYVSKVPSEATTDAWRMLENPHYMTGYDYRYKYGTNPHTWLSQKASPATQREYAATLNPYRTATDTNISSTSVLPKTDMRSDRYEGNPNLSFMVPQQSNVVGPFRASAEYIQMAPIEMTVPIPGLEFGLGALKTAKASKALMNMPEVRAAIDKADDYMYLNIFEPSEIAEAFVKNPEGWFDDVTQEGLARMDQPSWQKHMQYEVDHGDEVWNADQYKDMFGNPKSTDEMDSEMLLFEDSDIGEALIDEVQKQGRREHFKALDEEMALEAQLRAQKGSDTPPDDFGEDMGAWAKSIGMDEGDANALTTTWDLFGWSKKMSPKEFREAIQSFRLRGGESPAQYNFELSAHLARNATDPSGNNPLIQSDPIRWLRESRFMDNHIERNIEDLSRYATPEEINSIITDAIGGSPHEIAQRVSGVLQEYTLKKFQIQPNFSRFHYKYATNPSLSQGDDLAMRAMRNMKKEGSSLEVAIKDAVDEIEFNELTQNVDWQKSGISPKEMWFGMEDQRNAGEIFANPNIYKQAPHDIPIVNYQKVGNNYLSEENIYNYYNTHVKSKTGLDWEEWVDVVNEKGFDADRYNRNLYEFYKSQIGQRPPLNPKEMKVGGILYTKKS